MASFFRRRARHGQTGAVSPPCEISTEEWEDYVLVTVDQKLEPQKEDKHRNYSLESSLDSGYEEIHMPPPAAEEDTAAGAGNLEAKQVSP